MVFSSLEFLFWFLPFFLAIYYIIPQAYKNLCIFVFSFVFYAYGSLSDPIYIILLAVSVIANWFIGLNLGEDKPHRKLFLIAGLVIDFGALFVFKYTDFIFGNINSLFGLENGGLPTLGLVLPIGISFYTFQVVSYLVDVYRNDATAERSIIDFGTYIMMFPKFIVGPIVRFEDIQAQIHKRTVNSKYIVSGAKTFILGLGMKVLLANQLANLWNDILTIGFTSISVPLAWLGIISYSLQLYFDFYGYSLMAIGLGKLLGFRFPDNFTHPYISRSMTDFWRNWHITLGVWFKKYVYFPLGGNRKGTARTYFNMLIVWLFTGIWHGANWNFIIWGLVLFGIVSLEKSGFGKFLDNHKIFSHCYMTLLIPLTWLIFAVEDLPELLIYFGRLIGIGGEYVFVGDFAQSLSSYGVFIAIGILLSTKLPLKLYKKFENTIFVVPFLLAVLGFSIYCLYMGLNDPFMYFRF